MVRRQRISRSEPLATAGLFQAVRGLARPLRTSGDLDGLLNHIGSAKCVLLGEASHGTSEFYAWRAEITKQLIEKKGFSFVAVEGDWPDCYRLNRFVAGFTDEGPDVEEVLYAFQRWPTWMWANEEVADFIRWLRRHNDNRPNERAVGFYGLDVYSLWESLYEVMRFLRRTDGAALEMARRTARCFEPYGEDAQEYARATRLVPESCEQEVIDLLRALRSQSVVSPSNESEAHFVAEQNALVLKNAEAYYRTMVRGQAESWNVRDRHMAETLDRLLNHFGPNSRAVIWEHNTHVGDARYTDMADDGMVNIGQIVREKYGADHAALVGFGTHSGSVIAGAEWEAPMERMSVPAARPDSWEDVLHRTGLGDHWLLFEPSQVKDELLAWRGHRAIGVVYRPEFEHFGNYVPTVLPRRYDAFLFIDRTRALRPLYVPPRESGEVPETFPTGV